MGETREPAGGPELTGRALATGSALGVVLSAANVYTGLKAGFIDGGSITAAVLATAFFRGAKRPFGGLESNLAQTIAASAAVMSSVAGVLGPVPALALSGLTPGAGLIVAWGLSLGALGVLVALALRTQLIRDDGLPFPTGIATAEVIEAMARGMGSAVRRARTLLIAALLAAAVGWLRDGPALLPQAILLPGSVLGVACAELSLGLAVSPLLVSTGLLIGARAAGGMLLGSLLGYLGLAPWLVSGGVLPAEHAQLADWLTWPGAALMLSSSLTALALEAPSLARGLRDLRRLGMGGAGARPLLALLLVSVVVVLVVARLAFGVGALPSSLSIVLAVILCTVCARSAGETDIAPVGALGGASQLAFGGSGSVASLAAGSVVSGAASATAQTLWSFKTGERLGASVRAQVLGALLGVVVGGLVVVPTYAVIARVYGLGTERMPAAGPLSWKATADAVQGGLSALPAHAANAAAVALVLGIVLTWLAHTRFARWVVSPVAVGIGMLTPVSLCAAVALGGVCSLYLERKHRAFSDEHVPSLAGGVIAGESLFGVILAGLIAAGLIQG